MAEAFALFTMRCATRIQQNTSAKVVIIGGSLSGLTFALACARCGIPTRVLERATGRHPGGGALGVDRALLMRAVGLDPETGDERAAFPVVTNSRKAASWNAVHDWLCDQVHRCREITLEFGINVAEVVQDDTFATAITANGRRLDAQLVVGADGYQSVVRQAIDPEQAAATYAGYLLWRGLVPEAELPPDTRWAQTEEGGVFVTKTGYRLVAHPVASVSGSLKLGERLISFAWYDPTRTDLLRELHCLSSTGQVLSSLIAEKVPARVRVELSKLALRIWPQPWRNAIVHALDQRSVFATPVAEHFPTHLSRGRLAVIGDAAHVASPIVGQGFAAGVLDAEALANALKNAFDRPAPDILLALRIYEDQRLADTQELVAISRRWSEAFVRGEQIASPPALKQRGVDTESLLFRTRKKIEKNS